jgi:thiamine pyrophosphate-dependent acetolactate synthase large subunit-like protein
VNRAECLPLLAEMLEEHTLTVTSLSSNARIWSGVWDKGPVFASMNMGLCTGFALGLSLAFPTRKVIALDSDGSLMEDTGVLITIADARPENLVILCFDNESYARMGPTATSRNADLARMALGAGIERSFLIRTIEDYERAVKDALASPGPTFLQIKVEAETVRVQDTRVTTAAMKQKFLDRIEAHPDYGGWKQRPD